MRSRPYAAAAASLALAAGGVVAFAPASGAAPVALSVARPVARSVAQPVTHAIAVGKPKPRVTKSTPTLPTPKDRVDPATAVGGPRLASMGVITDLPAGVPAPPALRDVSWVLADLTTGQVVAAKAPHAKLLPASTLKTLTALTLIPRVHAAHTITATAGDANADGTRVGIVPGLNYTGRQLFEGLLMSSGNDAAYALAEAAGGRQATLAAMNQRAAYLGAHDTVAKDPAGLDVPGQTSSAYDLALIGRAALQLKDFRTYVTTKQADFPGAVNGRTKKRTTYKITNHNTLLFNYPGTIGIKNGYTVAAKRTFISAVTRGNRTYLLSEMYGLNSSWRPQAAMYDWAFRYGAKARPVGTLVNPGEVTTPPTPRSSARADADPATPVPLGDGPAPAAAAAAAALEGDRAAMTQLAPWVGITGLAAAVLLVALLGLRARRQRPRGRYR